MAGIVGSSMGQAIANIGSMVGNYMMQDSLQEDRQEGRRREREEDARRQAERDALYRRTAEQQMAASATRGSGGADGGMAAADIAEGGKSEGVVARAAGMTVPELRSLRKYSETGDAEPFKRDVKRMERVQDENLVGPDNQYSDAISRRESQLVEKISKELPPGFDKEIRAKIKALGEIEESLLIGGKYNEVAKGRQTMQEVNRANEAIDKPDRAGIIGQGMAAGSGKDLVGGDSNVTRNKFTGATSETKVGESVIAENKAQAAKYAKEAETGSRAEKNKEFQGLQQERLAIDSDLKRVEDEIKSLRKDTPKGWEAELKTLQEKRTRLESDKSVVQTRIRAFTESEAERGRGGAAAKPAPAPAPAAGGLPEPKTPEEVAKLKPGTRFRAPDGSIRYR